MMTPSAERAQMSVADIFGCKRDGERVAVGTPLEVRTLSGKVRPRIGPGSARVRERVEFMNMVNKKSRARVSLLAIALAISASGLAGCGKHTMTAEREPTAAPGTVSRPGVAVTFATLAHREISGTVKASGSVISAGEGQSGAATDGISADEPRP